SRRIYSAEEGGELSGRGDALWRMLLTANIADDGGENKVVQELAESPELLPSILRRARADAEKGEDASASPFLPDGGAVPPEVMCRMFRRLGEKLRTLPEDRKEAVLLSLDRGLEDGIDPSAASIADAYTDDEFLNLLATLLSVEGKGGKRLRKIFETIADQRDVDGSLLPRLNDRARESLRAKEYFSMKTWEAVETLLLSRSEDAYLEEEHSRFMEALSGDAGRMAARAAGLPPDRALLAAFGEEAQHRQAMAVLLELLAMETNDAEFLDLLEEVRKHLPNMISRKEFTLLEKVLGALSDVQKNAPGTGPEAVGRVIGELDFGHVVDLYLSREVSAEDVPRIPSLLAAFGREASVPVLERLLMEPEANRRKILMSLAVRIGVEAVPAIQERLSHPRWYFVRNLCCILGGIGFRGAVFGLARVLDHADPRVRKEAIQALGKLKAPEAVPFLGKILVAEALFSSQKEESLRIEAASALFRIGGTEAIGYLHQGKASRKAAVREHCSTLLRSRAEP
ncbi:MAG TPA: HEAT repeat domain-containing protein, partial [Candidatus Deferrimicrobiaceae bacterium]|nr:HEAT repeat domain-containing protein [Candidatus Deferrimicrobiaceae bacterium]